MVNEISATEQNKVAPETCMFAPPHASPHLSLRRENRRAASQLNLEWKKDRRKKKKYKFSVSIFVASAGKEEA